MNLREFGGFFSMAEFVIKFINNSNKSCSYGYQRNRQKMGTAECLEV